MSRLLLSALFILYFYSFGQATAEEHFLVDVKESGYLFGLLSRKNPALFAARKQFFELNCV